MVEKPKQNAKNRRDIVRQLASVGLLGSTGLAGFSSAAAAGGSSGDGGGGLTADPDMNLPAGGGGASDADYDAATAESNTRSDSSFDYTTLNEPSSNKTDMTVNDTVFGNEFTVDGDPAKVTYKYCEGANRQMVVSEVSITVEGSNGVAKYSQWAGISEDGCIYLGDSNGCIRANVSRACDLNRIMEAPRDHMDFWFTVANTLYDRAQANTDEFADAGSAVLWAIIAAVVFFLIALGNAFTGATS